jgi:hypothetical protein
MRQTSGIFFVTVLCRAVVGTLPSAAMAISAATRELDPITTSAGVGAR